MRWYLHGNLTPAARDAMVRHEQSLPVLEVAPDASADDLFKLAAKQQLEIMTNDPALAAAPFEQQIAFGRTLVFLQLEGGDVEQDDAIDRLFERYKRLSPGRLYTVTASRVKVRQLPMTR